MAVFCMKVRTQVSKQQFFVDTRAQEEQDSIAAAAFSDAKGAKPRPPFGAIVRCN
eukprot:COSAG06_NODE_5057_length_3755_cov_5.493982_6_plen_55_part_00